jgi:hypothetical protein
MANPLDGLHIPGLFIYKDRSGQAQGLLFQFNPETLKRTRTVSLQDSSTNQGKGTTTGRGEEGRKYSMKAGRWKIDLELRLDASRIFPKQLGMLLAQGAAGQAVSALAPFVSVMVALRQLEALVEPTELQVAKGTRGYEENAETPEVDFYWGDRVWKGYVTSLTINETLFSALLMPMVVEASVSMEIIEPMSSVIAGAVGGTLFR